MERMIIPINAKVASQTMLVTTSTSAKLTTSKSKAKIAPMMAVVPICKPLGCQITKLRVRRKREVATITKYLYM